MTLDSEDKDEFLVHISAGHIIKFIRGTSPCIYDFNGGNIHTYNLKTAFSSLNNISENKKLFKNREVRKSTDAVMRNPKTNHIAKYKFVRIVKDN